jgi:hypothetical protein
MNASRTMARVLGPGVFRVKRGNSTDPVAVDKLDATPIAAPVNSVAPAATGTAGVPQTLSVTTGTWTPSMRFLVFTYQWKRGGSAIPGATQNTYLTTVADKGQNITCDVTATSGTGSTVAASNAIAIPLDPANTVAPAITGTATTGNTLTVSNGTWNNSPTGFTYQWRRAGVDIPGQTAATHVVVAGDVGQALTCAVTATNASGSATAISNAVTPAS